MGAINDFGPGKHLALRQFVFGRLFGNRLRVQVLGRVAMSILAILLDNRFVPEMYSARPFFTLAVFALLICVGKDSRDGPLLPPLSAVRVTIFISVHSLLTLVGSRLAIDLISGTQPHAAMIVLASAAKSLLVLPAFALFPLSADFFRRYRDEVFATAIVFVAFFPGRYFLLLWPAYSKVLIAGAAGLCGLFVPGTYLTQVADTPMLIGPSVDMIIDFSCSGITGINLFHLLFGVVGVVEWNRLHKRRALICFVVGGIVYLLANFARIVLLFLIGNLVSARLNLDFLGWVLFAITFYVLMKISYGWMVGEILPKCVPCQPSGCA